MWTRNEQMHNELSSAAKMFAARAFYVESMSKLFQDMGGSYVHGANEFLLSIFEGKHDICVAAHVRVLNSATRISNAIQALMYLRGFNAPFDSKNPFEKTRYVATGGSSYAHGYLMRHSSYTRETETTRHTHPGAHKPKTRYTYDEDGEIICADPRGHSWVVSDENENVCYCSRCGCAEY